MSSKLLQVRIDSELKEKAKEVFENSGIDMSSAVRLFLQQAVVQNRIPFISLTRVSDEELTQDLIDKAEMYSKMSDEEFINS